MFEFQQSGLGSGLTLWLCLAFSVVSQTDCLAVEGWDFIWICLILMQSCGEDLFFLLNNLSLLV